MALSDKTKKWTGPLLAGALGSALLVFGGSALDGISSYVIPVVKLPLLRTLGLALAAYVGLELNKRL